MEQGDCCGFSYQSDILFMVFSSPFSLLGVVFTSLYGYREDVVLPYDNIFVVAISSSISLLSMEGDGTTLDWLVFFHSYEFFVSFWCWRHLLFTICMSYLAGCLFTYGYLVGGCLGLLLMT